MSRLRKIVNVCKCFFVCAVTTKPLLIKNPLSNIDNNVPLSPPHLFIFIIYCRFHNHSMPLAFFVLALFIAAAQAAPSPGACAACGQPPGETVFFTTNPYLKDRQLVCPECAKSQTFCEICQLPLRTNFVALKDGRWICKACYPEAVTSQDEARRLFDDMKRYVVRQFEGAGIAPNENIRVYLADRPTIDGMYRTQFFPHDQKVTLGLTRTKHLKSGENEHEIYLLLGLKRSRLMAVGAHEYCHAWLNQNLQEDRRLDADTVEGFCDLVAYNAMSEMGDTCEMAILKNNPHCLAPRKALLQAQEKYRFYATLKWMKSGVDDKLDPAHLDRLLALKESPAPQWAYLPQVEPPAPDRLILKNISGAPSRRFALVNNQTLAGGDTAKVRVGKTNVTVRCLQITENSVLVQIGDAKQSTELFLENKNAAVPLGRQPL
jgi:hypothetical protein